jgi:hypothetical protein
MEFNTIAGLNFARLYRDFLGVTGAQVMAMFEDVPALLAMKPGGKEHPIDKVWCA